MRFYENKKNRTCPGDGIYAPKKSVFTYTVKVENDELLIDV